VMCRLEGYMGKQYSLLTLLMYASLGLSLHS
jgi:hypothetical protein